MVIVSIDPTLTTPDAIQHFVIAVGKVKVQSISKETLLVNEIMK